MRLLIFVSVIASVMVGNIWGDYSSVALRHAAAEAPDAMPHWLEVAALYVVTLPLEWRNEMPFLVGGVFGGWIGLRYLRDRETISVE